MDLNKFLRKALSIVQLESRIEKLQKGESKIRFTSETYGLDISINPRYGLFDKEPDEETKAELMKCYTRLLKEKKRELKEMLGD